MFKNVCQVAKKHVDDPFSRCTQCITSLIQRPYVGGEESLHLHKMSKKKHRWDFPHCILSCQHWRGSIYKTLGHNSRCIIVWKASGFICAAAFYVLFWSTLQTVFTTRAPCVNSCQLLSHYNFETQPFMFVCAHTCLRGFVCVCVIFQNAPCGRARPWASVRRVCARLSPHCPLKRCRPRLSSFSRSVPPPLTPLAPSLLFCSTSSLRLLLSSPLYFSVWCSLWGSVQGIIHPTPVCPDHSPPLSPPTLGCTPWPSSPLPSSPLNQIKGSGTMAPAH